MKRFVSASVASLALSAAWDARADKPWVDRPLALPTLHASADAGIGLGTYEAFQTSDPNVPPQSLGTKTGWGSSLEAAVGLPIFGELGARMGYRFGDPGVAARGDHFARLFDPIVNEPGLDAWTNPELHLRGTLMDLEVAQLGLETRAIIPTAKDAYFALTGGLPLRIHVPSLMRIDTGIFFPIGFSDTTFWAVQIPAQAFFQIGDAFVGPLSGMRYDHAASTDPCNDTNDCNVAFFAAGVGGGYTLGGMLDLKAQVFTDRINSTGWSKHMGGGLGIGLRIP